LHVGLPKAASTSLQWALYENKTALQAQGFLYEPDGGPRARNHKRLVQSLLFADGAAVETVIPKDESRTRIVSHEGLTNHLYDFGPDALAHFRAATSHLETKAFLLIAERSKWIRSYYAQCVLNPRSPRVALYGTSKTLVEIQDDLRMNRFLDRDALCRDIKERLGADDVSVWNVEDDPVAGFSHSFECRLDRPEMMRPKNPSPPGWVVEFVRQLNLLEPNEGQRIAWKGAVGLFTESEHDTLKQFSRSFSRGQPDLPLNTALWAQIRPGVNGPFCLTEDDLTGFANFVGRMGW
jgi:hypothetical protein